MKGSAFLSDCEGKLSLVDIEYMCVVFVKSFSDPDVFHQCCLYKLSKLEVFLVALHLPEKWNTSCMTCSLHLFFLGALWSSCQTIEIIRLPTEHLHRTSQRLREVEVPPPPLRFSAVKKLFFFASVLFLPMFQPKMADVYCPIRLGANLIWSIGLSWSQLKKHSEIARSFEVSKFILDHDVENAYAVWTREQFKNRIWQYVKQFQIDFHSNLPWWKMGGWVQAWYLPFEAQHMRVLVDHNSFTVPMCPLRGLFSRFLDSN